MEVAAARRESGDAADKFGGMRKRKVYVVAGSSAQQARVKAEAERGNVDAETGSLAHQAPVKAEAEVVKNKTLAAGYRRGRQLRVSRA